MSQPDTTIFTQESIEKENEMIASWDQELEEAEYNQACQEMDSVYDVRSSLKGILHNNDVFEHLRHYMWKERTEENYIFWSDVQAYKHTYSEYMNTDYEKIWSNSDYIMDKYFNDDCRYELYIPQNMVIEIRKKYEEIKELDHTTTAPPLDLFDPIQTCVFNLIHKTSYQKFLKQDGIGRKLALTAQHIVLQDIDN